MGDGLKAHIGPGREGDDRQHTREGRGARGEGRRNAAQGALRAEYGSTEASHDATGQQQRHDDLHGGGNPAPQAEQRRNGQRRHRQQHLAYVDVITGDLVVEAELEQVAEQVSGNQGQRRGVGPYDGHIRQQHEPAVQEAVVIAEVMFCVGVGAARVGVLFHQVMVIRADDQHNQPADADAQHRPQGTGHRQEGGPWHDKSAPAHATTEGQRPGAQRRKIAQKALPPRLFH